MRNYVVWAICLGSILAASSQGRAEVPAKQQPEELVVIYVKVIEESDEGRRSQILSEPMLVTKFGRPTSFMVGGQVPDGSEYIDIGHRVDFLPTKRTGKNAIWVELRKTTTDYVRDKLGNGHPVESTEKITAKYQLGKENVSKTWKPTFLRGCSIHLEFRVETVTPDEYERKRTEEIAAAKSAKDAKKK